MIIHSSKKNRNGLFSGSGLINDLINKLPVELHVPGYQFCGPGTKLEKRINRGDVGINPLDAACREHDIAYSQFKDLTKRHEADKVLEDKAWKRVKAKDSPVGEKLSALAITGIMKGKRKFGMGIKTGMKKVGMGVKRKKSRANKRRIIKTPQKIGGFLPLLLPILGALGALGGGAASIAKAVNDAKASRQQLEESQRHNKAMEAAAKGSGLFIKPYKTGKGVAKGKGLFIKPYKGGSMKRHA